MKYGKDSSQECDDNKPSGPWPDGLYCSVTEPAENKQNQEKRKNKPSAPDLISDTNSKISFNQKNGTPNHIQHTFEPKVPFWDTDAKEKVHLEARILFTQSAIYLFIYKNTDINNQRRNLS